MSGKLSAACRRIKEKLPDTNQTLAIFTGLLFLAGLGAPYVARETMIYSERAYVYPNVAQGRTRAVVGHKLVILVPFVNSGHTPAERLSFWGICQIFDGPPFPKGNG